MRTPPSVERLGLGIINALAHSVSAQHDRISYGDHERHFLDWYRRRDDLDGGAAPRATVIFFYGGNWRSGRRQDYRFVADTLLDAGFDVMIPDYRLWPSFWFRDILADARAATLKALETLPAATPVFLMGHSAGAQMAALLTLDSALLGSERARLSGMVGLAGPYDFYPFTEDDHWELFGPDEFYPRTQPVNFVRDDAPPLYLLHGEDDNRVRRGHSKSLMEKQQSAGGRAGREVYPALGHVGIVLEFVRWRRGRSPVVRDVTAFLRDPGDPTRLGGSA